MSGENVLRQRHLDAEAGLPFVCKRSARQRAFALLPTTGKSFLPVNAMEVCDVRPGHAEARCRDDAAPRRDRRRHAHHRAGRRRGRCRQRDARLRERRADRLSPVAAGRGAAGNGRAGLAHPEILQRAQHPRRAARLRHLAVGRRAAARGRGAARHEPLQPHPRDRLPEPRRGRAAGRHQSRHHPSPSSRRASTTPPIHPRRSPARSAAMSRRIPAACIA